MKPPPWYRPRSYQHFDVPVGLPFAEAISPELVSRHPWSPLIHYIKSEKRYDSDSRKTIRKTRPIMFASHRDSCILSKYSFEIVKRLDAWYAAAGLNESVVAYRSLGHSNYHFARRVELYVKDRPSITVMCFDVTGFFDNLDHRRLKERLRWILDCEELERDWFAVFKFITKFKYVGLDDLKAHDDLAKRIKERRRHPLATIAQIKSLGVEVRTNPNPYGIPQGTPISASLSNLYMSAFDAEIAAEVAERDGLYQRYSDDILVACHPTRAAVLEELVRAKLIKHGLRLQEAKTERVTLAGLASSKETFQYLGYQLGQLDARLRLKSLSRQWRTARRAIKKAERMGAKQIAAGKSDKVFTRKLHTRFTDAGPRNFLAYAKRSADTLESPAIRRQAKKLRRFVTSELKRIRGK